MGKVGGMISVSVEEQTGLMRISAVTADPRLSADLVDSFIRHLQRRVSEFHTEKARQNLEYVRQRFEAAEEELQLAEEDLARFMDRNTSLQSARMQMEAERLQRNVQFKSQLYTSIQTQLTQAELELQRSNPVISVVERPVPPLYPDRTNPLATIIFAFVFGGFLGVGLTFVDWFFQMQQSDEESNQKVDAIRSALKGNRFTKLLVNRHTNGPGHVETKETA